jgi:hypothetical protein
MQSRLFGEMTAGKIKVSQRQKTNLKEFNGQSWDN